MFTSQDMFQRPLLSQEVPSALWNCGGGTEGTRRARQSHGTRWRCS
jgi:hypothetical protein